MSKFVTKLNIELLSKPKYNLDIIILDIDVVNESLRSIVLNVSSTAFDENTAKDNTEKDKANDDRANENTENTNPNENTANTDSSADNAASNDSEIVIVNHKVANCNPDRNDCQTRSPRKTKGQPPTRYGWE